MAVDGSVSNLIRVDPRFYFDGAQDFLFNVSKGAYLDLRSVNKFGQTSNADSGVATDIWDGANVTEDDDLWVAPTQARVHAITSNSDDDNKTATTGARTIRLWGLKTWDSKESSEDVTLSGTDAVNTAFSYVIIHRIKVLTSGAAGPNVGDIFATAATDGTITAMVIAGNGQTLMAVYGVPSSQTAYISQYYATMLKSGGAAVMGDVTIWVTVDVENQVGVFRNIQTTGPAKDGSSAVIHAYRPPNPIDGPCILKMQVISTAADSTVNGGFDLVLEDIA